MGFKEVQEFKHSGDCNEMSSFAPSDLGVKEVEPSEIAVVVDVVETGRIEGGVGFNIAGHWI
ncbi:hypothetical protein Pyn_03577 [Prunus yedoensis var. nudiflora]|uniref:Uncharacterized protein n=1 Tax=Prunus yedoensis var. nudiflora TaxID=2094558 RepID=A0A314UHE2_PRUYE|nr:hypothetical protein Pyn_03577 [Prunus yedoensis var. nudiflora]